jgi:hypothetical protein
MVEFHRAYSSDFQGDHECDAQVKSHSGSFSCVETLNLTANNMKVVFRLSLNAIGVQVGH